MKYGDRREGQGYADRLRASLPVLSLYVAAWYTDRVSPPETVQLRDGRMPAECPAMNILALGRGKAGSWQMRGEQLAGAIGARVTSDPTLADWKWADVVFIVKRSEPLYGPPARKHGLPIV